MVSCPWCGSDLYGYNTQVPDKSGRGKVKTGIACCPWCKWSGKGDQYIDLDDDEERIPYRHLVWTQQI